MGDQAKKLLELALALSVEERRDLIEALVAAEHELDPEWENAWAAEIAERIARDPDGARSVPAAEAIAAARVRLRPA